MKAKDDTDQLHLAIDRDTLQRLLVHQQVGVNELRCLDARSKELVWRLCLDVLKKRH